MNSHLQIETDRPTVCHAILDHMTIWIGPEYLHARLQIPPSAKGIVVFGQTTGIDRLSNRAQQFSGLMEQWGIGVLLVELLTTEEQAADGVNGQFRTNIGLLAARIVQTVRWARRHPACENFRLALFGIGPGASASLVAGAFLRRDIQAIVGFESRPDTAIESLPHILAPTLLVSSQQDLEALRITREIMPLFHCEKALAVMPIADPEDKLVLAENIARRTARWLHAHWKSPWRAQTPAALRWPSAPSHERYTPNPRT